MRVNREHTDGQPAIAVQNLVKTYPGPIRAVEGLSFAVEAGSVFGLLGPNGAGKSTVIKILTTLTLPDGGHALVEGVDVVLDPRRVRRIIGVVAQRSGADPTATGSENLSLQGKVFGMGGAGLRHRVDDLLDRFGLTEAAGRRVKTYSGGMQRRLDIAMGMVHHPQVLFLDEPTTGLDPEVRTEMWEEIARLSAEGMSVLLTTHYLEEADRLADRLVIIDRGRLVAEGTPEALKAELRGDAIAVELVDSANEAMIRAALGGSGGISGLSINGRSLYARVGAGATAVPTVLSALERAGLKAASVTISRPSLDDVYLRYTGRVYEAANTEGVNR